jgi:Filamin/ABP280 repeat
MCVFLGVITPEVKDNDDGTYDVTYYPPSAGSNLKANIKYDGKDIPNRYNSIKIFLTGKF